MNRRWLFLFFSTCILIAGAGCNHDSFNRKDRAAFAVISEGVSHAASLTLYEGLPHPEWEHKTFTNELATRKTITLHGFSFYERPLPVAAADVETLRALCMTNSSFKSFSTFAGVKKCGEYHPDYCLAWKDGSTNYELLICFGCDEMKLFAPNQELYVDLQHYAYGQFRGVLETYRDQRPK